MRTSERMASPRAKAGAARWPVVPVLALTAGLARPFMAVRVKAVAALAPAVAQPVAPTPCPSTLKMRSVISTWFRSGFMPAMMPAEASESSAAESGTTNPLRKLTTVLTAFITPGPRSEA